MTDRDTVIRRVKNAPEETLDEILDFIDFVSSRRRKGAANNEIMNAQATSMQQIWDNPDDEVWNDVQIR